MFHRLAREHGFVMHVGGQHGVAGDVLRQHHAADAGRGQGGGCIHAAQAAVGLRREDGGRMQGAAQLRQVVDVGGGAGHLGARALVGAALADGGRCRARGGLQRACGVGGVRASASAEEGDSRCTV